MRILLLLVRMKCPSKIDVCVFSLLLDDDEDLPTSEWMGVAPSLKGFCF